MSKTVSGVQKCLDAFERLKAGKPNIEKFKNLSPKQVTASVVSQEAGFDSGYLKDSRHRPIITLINAYRLEEESDSAIRKRDHEKLKADKDALKSENEYLKNQLDKALGRELMLIRKLGLMEKTLAEHKLILGDKVVALSPSSK